MCRINGQGRQHRKDIGDEMLLPDASDRARSALIGDQIMIPAASISLRSGSNDACCVCISARASVWISASCSAGLRPSSDRPRIARPHQRAQAGHPHGKELIQIGGRDRQEAQPLQQGHGGVCRLFQHPPVEGQPAQLAVEEPARIAGAFRPRQVNRRRGRGISGNRPGSWSGALYRYHGGFVTVFHSAPVLSSTSAANARVTGRPSASARASRSATSARAASIERGIRVTR